MKNLIKRGVAFVAIAAVSCATGLFAPASAAPAAAPSYYLENVADPGLYLWAESSGRLWGADRKEGLVPWSLLPSAGGVWIFNHARGCVTDFYGTETQPVMFGCILGPLQVWFPTNQQGGTLAFRSNNTSACLSLQITSVQFGDCNSSYSRWRLVPA